MAPRVRISWDKEGDILRIDLVEPYLGQETDVTDDWTVVRTNPRTGAAENVEIMDFSRHFGALSDKLELPFSGQFSPLIEDASTRFLKPAANQ